MLPDNNCSVKGLIGRFFFFKLLVPLVETVTVRGNDLDNAT